MIAARLIVAALAVLAVAGVGAPPARAATEPEHAWWWAVQGAAPAAVPSDPVVENGELLVAADPTQAHAVAALRFELDDRDEPVTLVLDVARSTGTVAIRACRTISAWEPVAAGAWATRPDFRCDPGAEGVVSEDGTAVTFDLGAIPSHGALDVVLHPLEDDAGRYELFELVLEAPSSAALTTVRDPSAAPPARDDGGAPPPSIEPAPFDGGLALPALDAPPMPAALPQRDAGAAALVPEARPQAPTAPLDLAAGIRERFGDSRRFRLVAALIAADAAVLYVWLAQRSPRTPRGLGRLAAVAHPVALPAPLTRQRGVGRFRRPVLGADRSRWPGRSPRPPTKEEAP